MEKTKTLVDENGVEILVTYTEGTDHWEGGKINDWVRIESVEIVIAKQGVEIKRLLSEDQIYEIADQVRDMD